MISQKTINYLLVIFAIVLAGEAVFLSAFAKEKVSPTKVLQTSTLALEGPEMVSNGQMFNVTLRAQDPHPIGALDAVIDFNPSQVQVIGLDKLVKDPGAEYPQAKFDNSQGTITLSLVMFSDPLEGSREIATIKLQPIAKANAGLNIRFLPGQTTDSNVVLEGSTQDSLSQVSNYKVTIN